VVGLVFFLRGRSWCELREFCMRGDLMLQRVLKFLVGDLFAPLLHAANLRTKCLPLLELELARFGLQGASLDLPVLERTCFKDCFSWIVLLCESLSYYPAGA